MIYRYNTLRIQEKKKKKESTCQCRGHGLEPWSGKIPHATEQLSPCATTTEPVLYSPRATTAEARVPRARAPQQEKPPQ